MYINKNIIIYLSKALEPNTRSEFDDPIKYSSLIYLKIEYTFDGNCQFWYTSEIVHGNQNLSVITKDILEIWDS